MYTNYFYYFNYSLDEGYLETFLIAMIDNERQMEKGLMAELTQKNLSCMMRKERELFTRCPQDALAPT